MTRLKSHETPRRGRSRNDKGRSTPRRAQQLAKRNRQLINRLKRNR